MARGSPPESLPSGVSGNSARSAHSPATASGLAYAPFISFSTTPAKPVRPSTFSIRHPSWRKVSSRRRGKNTASPYTSRRLKKSRGVQLAAGYTVRSGNVKAFRKVDTLPRISTVNGSRSGKRAEPASTECSRMCAAPVSSRAGVANENANRFSVSAEARWSTSHPVAAWRNDRARHRYSSTGRSASCRNPWIIAAFTVPTIRAGPRPVHLEGRFGPERHLGDGRCGRRPLRPNGGSL